MNDPLALNPSALAELEHFGDERQPMLRIDSCLADPQRVLSIAAGAGFAPMGEHYPGVRSPIPVGAVAPLLGPLAHLLMQAFCLPAEPKYFEGFLSLVTHGRDDLAAIQRFPHFDGLDGKRLALLIYLDTRETGGTAFYRQRKTRFESVDAYRIEAYRSALAQGISDQGMPESDYIRGDTAMFEQTFAVAGTFNRAVVYRGNTLHCANLPESFVPDPDPLAGRLTLNLFLQG